MSGAMKVAAASTVAIAIAAVLPLTAAADPGRDRATPRSSVAPPAARLDSPRCTADQLRLRTVHTGSNMSQPYARIAVRNVSARACTVSGYPRLTARGVRVGRANVHRIAIHVKRGSFMEAHDRGARPIGLRPGGNAVFSVGTATAYGPRLVELRSLRVRLPRIEGRFHVALGIDASAPRGKRVPVFLTALDWRVH
jgi:hypothetical protein